MLTSLSIRDVVLIEKLDLNFEAGLCVLTGETGAGKSILLDALGLALGGRSDVNLIRRGAEQATVIAAMEVAPEHPVQDLLREHGFDDEGQIILRRTVGLDGRTRAYLNDRPTSVGLLREAGDLLVEIQGQFEQRGLLDPATHLPVLDAYAGLGKDVARAASSFEGWRNAEAALAEAQAKLAKAREDEDYLRHSLAELDDLEPREDEEDALSAERTALMNREKLVEALNAALAEIGGDRPVEESLRRALGQLERMTDRAGGILDTAIAALDRASVETAEALAQLEAAGGELDDRSDRLQHVDDRLFALRDAARKHRVTVAELPKLRDRMRAEIEGLEHQGENLETLQQEAQRTRAVYETAARSLSQARAAAAERLDKAVQAELPPLKLDKAQFRTRVDALDESRWGPRGMDRVAFEVATNPGTEPGPIARIASGGELARFMLALKVVVAGSSPVPTLVFDEVDAGIGGATAAAVGERLARLGQETQVLVVTHSPQVAARGRRHLRVEKAEGRNGKDVVTDVSELADDHRREEIARMLSAHDVTDEARAAADVLIGGGQI